MVRSSRKVVTKLLGKVDDVGDQAELLVLVESVIEGVLGFQGGMDKTFVFSSDSAEVQTLRLFRVTRWTHFCKIFLAFIQLLLDFLAKLGKLLSGNLVQQITQSRLQGSNANTVLW
jgi:hypothetical protein